MSVDQGAATGSIPHEPTRCTCGCLSTFHKLSDAAVRMGCSNSNCGCKRFAEAPRPWTPDEKTATGTRITVKRACNGCGSLLGDVTEAEMDRAIDGLPAEDVRAECPRCSAAEAVS